MVKKLISRQNEECHPKNIQMTWFNLFKIMERLMFPITILLNNRRTSYKNGAKSTLSSFENGDIFEDEYEGWYSTTAGNSD